MSEVGVENTVLVPLESHGGVDRLKPVEEQLWIVYGELLEIVPEEAHSAIHTAIICHCLEVGDPLAAYAAVSDLCFESDESESARTGKIIFNDKVKIFTKALEAGEVDILMGLGDLRAEAEHLGPKALGVYICAELSQGWSMSNNLDSLETIISHAEGKSGDLDRLATRTLDKLAARLWLDGKVDDFNYVVDRAIALGYPVPRITHQLIRAFDGDLKLKDLRLSKVDRYKYRRDGHVRNGQELLGIALLSAMEPSYVDRVTSSHDLTSKFLGEYRTETRVSEGAKVIIAKKLPDLVGLVDSQSGQMLSEWHEVLLSPDLEPTIEFRLGREETTYPQSLTYLEEWLSQGAYNPQQIASKAATIIDKLSKMVKLDVRPSDAHDKEVEAGLLGELELLKEEIDKTNEGLPLIDTIDRLRHQSRFNKPLQDIFSRSIEVKNGAGRLEVQFLAFEIQKQHDPNSEDSKIKEMCKTILKTAKSCQGNILDRRIIGDERIQSIIEDVTEMIEGDE